MSSKQFEGQERPVCPECGRVAYPSLKVGAGALILQDGALLLVQRSPDAAAFPGTWNLPSGYCEADESPEAAAVRETEEETGLAVRASCLVGAYYFEDDPRGHGVLLVYEARIVGGTLHGDGHETVQAGFFPPGQLPAPLCGGGHDQAIAAWRARAMDRWQPGEPLRYCPHCGHSLQLKNAFGRLRLTCPTCGFVHFESPKVGVSVLIEKERRVLLVRRAIDPGLGKWCLPSGFIEVDESPEAAAIRECAEETGLTVSHLDLLEVMHYTADFRGPGINLTYRAQVTGGKLQAGDDAETARFFTAEELPPLESIAFRSHRQALERWRGVA